MGLAKPADLIPSDLPEFLIHGDVKPVTPSPLLPCHDEDMLTLVWDLSAAGSVPVSVLIHHGWAVTELAKAQFYFCF